MPYKYEILYKLLDEYPNATYKDAKKEITTLTEPYFNKLKSLHKTSKGKAKSNGKSKKVKKLRSAGSDNSSISDNYLDDPDELLLSVAIRELNKKNPDPRWATILINCKKENINTKGDVLEQFKQLPTQTLVNILSKNLQEESE